MRCFGLRGASPLAERSPGSTRKWNLGVSPCLNPGTLGTYVEPGVEEFGVGLAPVGVSPVLKQVTLVGIAWFCAIQQTASNWCRTERQAVQHWPHPAFVADHRAPPGIGALVLDCAKA